MGGGVRKAGFKGGGGGLGFHFQVGVNSGVTLKGLRRVDTTVVVVEESCVEESCA